MLTSTALVLLMSVPALALFYGGLVRTKNMLSVLMQVFVGFSLITVLWCMYGYSLAFTAGNAFIGGLQPVVPRRHVRPEDAAPSRSSSTFSKNTPLYELVYVAFQATFAAITCCLILGSWSSASSSRRCCVFLVHLVHLQLSARSRTWCGTGRDRMPTPRPTSAQPSAPPAGLIWQWGALDFAGGTVVHINAGVAGLVGAFVLGKRVGFGKEPMPPHNLTLTMVGASLLWFGWFGFNAGSALEANGSAALAFMNTYLATACAVLSWIGAEWLHQGQALDARRSLGRGGGPGRDHACGGQRRHPGRIRDRHSASASCACGA